MSRTSRETFESYWRLLRFIAVYGLLVAFMFNVLPEFAENLQQGYEAIDVRSRLLLVVALSALSVAGLLHTARARSQVSAGQELSRRLHR